MIELQEKKRRVQALLDSLTEGRSQVERLQERISRLKALSTAVTPVYGREGGQRGRPSRGKSEVVDQLCDETERLGVQILRLLAVERQVEAWIDLPRYRAEVLRFADTVEAYYQSCQPKRPEDEFSRRGYQAFWNEWHRRRGEK